MSFHQILLDVSLATRAALISKYLQNYESSLSLMNDPNAIDSLFF